MNSIFNISDEDIHLFITSYNKNLLNGTVISQIPLYVELLKTIKHYRDNNIEFETFFLKKHNFTEEDNNKLNKLLNRLRKGKNLYHTPINYNINPTSNNNNNNKNNTHVYSYFNDQETYDENPKFEILQQVEGAMDDYYKKMNKIKNKRDMEKVNKGGRAWDSVDGVNDRYYTAGENSERGQIEFDKLGFARSKLFDIDKSDIINKLSIVDDVLKNNNLMTNDFDNQYKRGVGTIQNNNNIPYNENIENGLRITDNKLKNRDPVSDRFWQDNALLNAGPSTSIRGIKNEQSFENQFQYLDDNYNRVPDARLNGSATRFQNRSTFKR
jgi:hypothetical protein